MKIYITRHGQVLADEYIDGDTMFPRGDLPLSKLGEEQAASLGRYLKEIGFDGVIFSSPYARTLQTAQLISNETGSRIVPFASIREMCFKKEVAESFTGMTIEKILEFFPSADRDAKLEYPWWGADAESRDDVFARVSDGMSSLGLTHDTLFVGHGASVRAMLKYYGIPEVDGVPPWNCALSSLDTETGETVFNATAHLTPDKVTSNATYAFAEK